MDLHRTKSLSDNDTVNEEESSANEQEETKNKKEESGKEDGVTKS